MDGIYDLGGVVGFGAVTVEADEPTFHEPWESTAFRLLIGSVQTLQAFNVDEYRHSIERIDPVRYLDSRYYERVLTGVTTLLIEKGFLSLAEIEERVGGPFPLARPARPNIHDGHKGSIDDPAKPRFSLGDRIRVRENHQPGHTRVPKYVRGRTGIVAHVAPAFSYPDASAHGLPTRREPTYHVAFSAVELWGEAAEAGVTILVDLWESYLQELGDVGEQFERQPRGEGG